MQLLAPAHLAPKQLEREEPSCSSSRDPLGAALFKLHIPFLGTQPLPCSSPSLPFLQGHHGNAKARAVVVETVL